jgi:hypothetical protein
LLSRKDYIRVSLEINLFFHRIMKEHLFFIETHLPPVNAAEIAEAKALKQSFEQLLAETVNHANGAVSENAVKSHEFVTPYTLKAEEVTSMLTGASINTRITRMELGLSGNPHYDYSERLENIVCDINTRSLNLLQEVIAFKKKLIDLVSKCQIFVSLYPEMLKHLLEEAEYYQELLESLQDKELPKKTLCEELNFWNHIMGEHAEFIDGMLDPSEEMLKEKAETFVERFERLVKECIKTAENRIIQRSEETTEGIRDYKRAATEGLLACKIKSIIPPLLADHVLREANHFLRVLKMLKK